MTYKEFLEVTGQISEEEFNTLANSLPEVSEEEFKDALGRYVDLDNSLENYAVTIASAVVNRYTTNAYVDGINLELHEICIVDIETLEELRKLGEVFSEKGWSILDYDYIEEEFIVAEQERAEKSIRDKYLRVIHNLPISKLKDIVENL